MDVSLLIRHRLAELGLEQKDLASAAQVTESYVSQLLSRKKAPPAPARTGLYDRMGEFLKLPKGELSKLAEAQRQEELKKKVAEPPRALFKECRDLILRKCVHERRNEIERIFEKQPFGELERLVAQKFLDVAQAVAREELRNEAWLRRIKRTRDRSYEQLRAAILEFLDTDVFNISPETLATLLDPMIESWDMDLKTFSLEIVLNRRLAPGRVRRFEFAERDPEERAALDSSIDPSLAQFLKDPTLSPDITEEEIEFLRGIRFAGRRPAPLYYYRELQSLRDPLHFPARRREVPRRETLRREK